MGWKLIEKPSTMRVTKKLATEFMEMTPAPHDRSLSERRLQVYARLLGQGAFRPVTWAKALCEETNDVYRVNGKHTSTLLAGLAQVPEFYVTVESYGCETLEDVAKLYATFDSSMMSRTARDIYMSFASTVKELAGVQPRIITAGAGGIGYQKLGEGLYSNSQPAERAEALLEHPEFVLWLQAILTGGEKGASTGSAHCKHIHLYRIPVVAAMFAGWQKSKSAATDFWSAVRDETGTRPDLPDRKIAKWLVLSSLTAKENTRIRKAGNRETFVKCIHAWNAWRKGENTNLNYRADKDIPAIK